MKVYRISKTEYARDFSGTGAKLFGGRWNHVNTPCIYTAASQALAVVEFSVNVNVEFVPLRLSMAIFELRESAIFRPDQLPEDWMRIPSPLSTKDFGTVLLKQNVPVFEVPSVVVPGESNFVLNPTAAGTVFELIDIREFTYDLRIKK